MAIDYREELLLTLENNEIKTLPSQELIDSEERVVRAVWKNYSPDIQNNDFASWYEQAGWGKLLRKYDTDVELWQHLLKSKFRSSYNQETSYDFILSQRFKTDFPIIANHFLGNNELLIDLYNKTNNEQFFKLIKLDLNKTEDVFKLFSLNRFQFPKETIARYENDREFVNRLLNRNASYFNYLNGENKDKNEYIKLALREMRTFFSLKPEKQDEFFKPWVNIHLTQIKLKNIENLTVEQQAYILSKRPDFVSAALSGNNGAYKRIATSCLINDVEKHIASFDDNTLMDFAQNNQNLAKIKGQLETFVENYVDLGANKAHNKMLLLVRLVPDLQKCIEENIFYQVNQQCLKKQRKDAAWFESVSEKVISLYEDNKIRQENANSILSKARNCLTIEAMKELRVPKQEPFQRVRIMLLEKKLQENLPVNQPSSRKVKI